MINRRPLRGKNTNAPHGEAKPAGAVAAPQPGQRPPGQGRNRPGRNRNRNQNQSPGAQRQGQPAQPPQPGQRPQQGRQNQQRPARPPQPRRTPPPPPAYIQRDLLLVALAEGTQGIDEVRAKLDPLAKKLPTHISLLLPEPAATLGREFLKTLETKELPPLETLTFHAVMVHDDMYLWLMPDDESRGKIKQWQEFLVGKLGEINTQDKDYAPHITLGYIPRSMTEEDALAFAKLHISTPLTLKFEKILLEEFSENQNSTPVDSVPFIQA